MTGKCARILRLENEPENSGYKNECRERRLEKLARMLRLEKGAVILNLKK